MSEERIKKALDKVHLKPHEGWSEKHEETFLKEMGLPKGHSTFRPSGDRGFHTSDAHKAAEELRMEGKGSHDPAYHDSKKNK